MAALAPSRSAPRGSGRTRPRRRFSVILFDVGGTLVENQDYDGWAEIAGSLGLNSDPDAMVDVVRAAVDEFERPGAAAPTPEALWRSALSRLQGGPVPDPTVSEFLERLDARPRSVQLFSDVRRTLDRLSAEGRTLAVVSNSRSEAGLYELLGSVGILGYFSALVSSGTEGVAKPDPEIFRRAARRLGVEVGEAFHVGDLPYTDAKAAAAAGLGSVWLNRYGTGFGEDPPEITSLLELPRHVARVEGARVK